MEQELEDFNTWIENFQLPPTKYVAVFDPISGSVLKVGPDYAFDDKNQIALPEDVAIDILEGRIKLHHCFIDTTLEKLEITEVQQLTKIDDVLHRIISKEWTEGELFDLYLTYSSKESKITLELSNDLGGTKKTVNTKPRKIFWDGETEMNFLVTDYNDPHIIYDTFSVTIDQLISNQVIVKLKNLPKRFSVYTRRLFKKYVIEYK